MYYVCVCVECGCCYVTEDFPTDGKSKMFETVIVETNFALMSKVANRLMKV